MTWPYFILIAGICLSIGAVLKFHYDEKESDKEFKKLKNSFDRLLSQKKSSEIRVGKIGENMAPFMEDWPYDPNKFRFIGNPVDGIQFTDNEIIFVEIKTGKSRLTKSQRKVRDILRKKGTVSFATFRVDENGCKLKRDEEDDDN